MSIFRIIITAVIFFFVYRFLQRLMTPSSLKGESFFSRFKNKRARSQEAERAVDAEFEELDDTK